MTNAQAQTILTNLRKYAHSTYNNVNQAMLNRAITDDNARQNALTEYEAVCIHLKCNGYKLVDEVTKDTVYLNTERFETVPVIDVHGVITEGTKNTLVTFNAYGTLLNEIKQATQLLDVYTKAGIPSMIERACNDLHELNKRKASIDANTRLSIRWETQAESMLRESKRTSRNAIAI